MKNKRILVIPDLYLGDSSGATVTQVLVNLFQHLEFQVGIVSSEFKQKILINGVICYPCRSFCGTANIKSNLYLGEFVRVLDDFKPTHLFFDGSITNKPLCYIEEGINRGLHIDIFIFMQDFFCAKLYANDAYKPCYKCLDSLLYAFVCPLIPKNKAYFKLFVKQYERMNLRRLLTKVDHVITSTDEQISFFEKYGIPKSKCYKMPLPFIFNRYIDAEIKRGGYLVGIAQNRAEKGFQFVPEILKYTHKTKLVLAYYDETAVNKAKEIPGMKDLMMQGKITLVAASWKTGLSELIAKSGGVVIPSIWPTTTEYGLLEAMAFSKPIVAFKLGIHKEKMRDGIHGYFANIEDLNSFAQKMDLLSTCSLESFDYMVKNIQILYHNMTDIDMLEIHLKNILG